jgi:hypothetical protein
MVMRVAMLEAYFDESGSHDGSPVLCVAGYVFEKDRCLALDLSWKAVLERFGLPYFHMVDCAHGSAPFDKLTKPQRIEVETLLIQLIRRHSLFGFAMAVPEKDYDAVLPPPNPLGSAYTYCCWTVLSVIHEWIVRTQFVGKVAYFFEAGHQHGPEANAVMDRIFNHPNLRGEYRYGGHSFIDKQNRPMQAADLLAWQHATDVKKILAGGTKKRADFLALIENQPMMLRYVSRDDLQRMRRQIDATTRGERLVSGTFGAHSFISEA